MDATSEIPNKKPRLTKEQMGKGKELVKEKIKAKVGNFHFSS